MAIYPSRRRFTVGEYHRMAQAGILGEDDRVELIDGEIVEMTPIGSRHAACIVRLTRLFAMALGDDALVSIQNPVRLDEKNEPQPDCALLRPRPDCYAASHPMPEDVLLLVEVGDSSVESDRRVKAPLYGLSGIPELWVVDLEQETMTVYRDRGADGYRTVRVLRRGEQIAPSAFPDRLFAVADILG